MKKETGDRDKVGVIGAGSFGSAIANTLAKNAEVIVYVRSLELAGELNRTHRNKNIKLDKTIKFVSSFEKLAKECTVIFPIVPSKNFREMMRDFSKFLRPYHILIHGTKGFSLNKTIDSLTKYDLSRGDISTMSEVIYKETVVLKVGCLSGPNLAKEILEGQPTATVIASKFDEVIEAGKKYLSSENFHVFGTYDLIGAEMAGALKNIFAIGSGILTGIGYGKNIQALLITRGMMEMIYFGKAVGASSDAFLGTAGIGDLVCTSTSDKSRNFSFGVQLGQGKSPKELIATFPELVEGVRTLKIAKLIADHYKIHVPITQTLYKIIYEELEVNKAISLLMRYPYHVDVDFL